jgi:thymidylate synthase ThyX
MLITVVPPRIEILTPLNDEHLKLLELAGRTAYKSEDRITNDSASKFVKMIRDLGHDSVLEHVSASVRIIGSRSMSHQLVRHRIASYCLAGDTTVVSMPSAKRHHAKRWTLEQLYNMSLDPKRKGRLKLIKLRSVNSEGVLIANGIKSISYSGRQQVYKVTSEFGRDIRATANHRFLTPNGWKKLSQLKPGDKIIANGLLAYKNKEWLENLYLRQNLTRAEVAKKAGVSESFLGKWLRHFGLQKPHSMRPNRRPGHGTKGMFSPEAIEYLSKIHLGAKNPMWKGENATPMSGRCRANRLYKAIQCFTCGTTEARLVRHHKDGDTLNNTPDNICILCEPCHKQFHFGQAVQSVFSDTIISIIPDKVTETYDIEMEAPWHNFVANGFVVHNCQESQRFVNYSKKGFQVICPPKIGIPCGPYHFLDVNTFNFYMDDKFLEKYPDNWFTGPSRTWLASRADNYLEYLYYLKKGIPPEDARECLPNATKTEIVMTANLRQWRSIFIQRALNKHAQWQIRQLMQGVLIEFGKALPAVFGDQLLQINLE